MGLGLGQYLNSVIYLSYGQQQHSKLFKGFGLLVGLDLDGWASDGLVQF